MKTSTNGKHTEGPKPPTRRLVAVLAAVAVIAIGCTAALAQPAKPAPGTARLTVLLYSGRPDPSVVLDAAAVAHLSELVQAAPAAEGFDGETVLPSILGYKGVLVETAGDGALPRYVAVYGGTVELRGDGARFVRDEGGAVESFLLETATQAGVLDEGARRMIAASRGDKAQTGD